MKIKYFLILNFIIFNTYILAGDISLKSILKNINNTSNELKLLNEDLKLVSIAHKKSNSAYDSTLYLDAQYGKKDFFEKNINNSYAYVVFKKGLYNSKANSLNSTFDFDNKIKKQIINYTTQKEKIKYMSMYFDIFLSDLYYQYQLERIVMIYMRKKDAKDNLPLGRSSQIDIYKTNATFLDASNDLSSAKENKNITRTIFANITDINETLLNDLEKPNIKFYWKKDKFDYPTLKEKMYKNNLDLKILKNQIAKISNKIKALNNNHNINISLNAKVGSEPRITTNNDDIRWQGSVNLSMPLYDKSINTYDIQSLNIQKNKLLIKKNILKQNLNKNLLTLLLKLKQNIKKKNALYEKYDYADLNSEKSRTLFEMDRKSDLGNSLAFLTKIQYEFRKNEYEYVLNYEKLNLLIGEKNEIY